MKNIQIKASQFFDMLKERDASMWDVFAQLVDGEEKEIIFLDDDDKILFNYILPTSIEQLQEDKKTFAAEYTEKLSGLN